MIRKNKFVLMFFIIVVMNRVGFLCSEDESKKVEVTAVKKTDSQVMTQDVKAKNESSASMYLTYIEEQYKPHGWAKCQSIKNDTENEVLLFHKPQNIKSEFPEGSIVAIKALKTGYGNYYQVKKDEKGVWRLFSDAKTIQDAATHFFVSYVGDGIALSSEVAGGFFVASDPKTFEVFLQGDKPSDNATWVFVEDPKAGPTSQSCFLKCKSTNGFLTSTVQDDDTSIQSEIGSLQNKIKQLEKDVPYLTITSARTESCYGGFSKDLSRDVTEHVKKRIQPFVLDANGRKVDVGGVGGVIETKADLADWSGVSKARWNAAHGTAVIGKRGRDLLIKYMEGNDKTEKEIKLSKIEGKNFKIVADINKHPATPLRKKLEDIQLQMAGREILKTSELARTGFQGVPFDKIDQWGKISIQAVSGLGADADDDTQILGESEKVEAKSLLQTELWAHKAPEFKGFGKINISDFGSEKVGFLDALYAQGVAWFDSMLPVTGQGTIFFRAKADQGDVHVCFGEELGPKVVYRVAFGTEGNSKIIIYKGDKKVQEVSSDLNPMARIVPGEVEKFWVSINNGFILVGKGDAGTNLIMGWQDPQSTSKILYVGLSTFKSKIIVSDVQRYPDPIVFFPPQKSYDEDKENVTVGTKDLPAWHKIPLSPPNAGMIVFKAKGKELSLALASEKDDKQGYKVTFGDGVTKISDLEDGEEVCKIDAPKGSLAAIDSDKLNLFWLSFYKGFFVAGSGEIGKNAFWAFYDFEYAQKISRIGFSGDAIVQELQVWPEIEFGFPQTTSGYAQKRIFSAVKGNIVVFSPFNYRILQSGPQVMLKDNITGDQWNIAGTPEPDSTYLFSLQIKSTGDPDFQFVSQSVSATKKALKVTVEVAEKSSEIVNKAAMVIAQGTTEFLIPSLVATAAAAATQAADAALSAVAATGKAKLQEIEAAASREVKVDKPVEKTKVVASVSDTDKKNCDAVVSKLEAVSVLDLTDAEKMESITKLWSDILRLITGFYVVQDTAVKQKIINGVANLYTTVMNSTLNQDSLSIYLRMLDILMKAYNNPYLTKAGEILEEQQRKNWYTWINEMFKKLYNSPLIVKTGLALSFGGEYVWVPEAFSTPGKGSVVFEAKSYKDIFVGFCESPFEVSAKSTRMYEIVFGESAMEIRRKNMGDSVVEFDYKTIPDLAPDPMNFKKYWITLDNGVFSGGVGDFGQNKLWEWKDPYPASAVKWVGFSTGQGEVNYRNIKTGSTLSTGASASKVINEAKFQAPVIENVLEVVPEKEKTIEDKKPTKKNDALKKKKKTITKKAKASVKSK